MFLECLRHFERDLWLVVHLRSILGIKNKLNVFLNWVWGYINYKQNLRLILRPDEKMQKKDNTLS